METRIHTSLTAYSVLDIESGHTVTNLILQYIDPETEMNHAFALDHVIGGDWFTKYGFTPDWRTKRDPGARYTDHRESLVATFNYTRDEIVKAINTLRLDGIPLHTSMYQSHTNWGGSEEGGWTYQTLEYLGEYNGEPEADHFVDSNDDVFIYYEIFPGSYQDMRSQHYC